MSVPSNAYGASQQKGPAPGTGPLTAPGHYPNPQNREQWANELLRRLGVTHLGINVRGLVAWETIEGGHWNNSATYNPLNTTLPMPGSHPMNSAGVQAYTSWDQGFQATVQTLHGDPRYKPILTVLGNPQATVSELDKAVGDSPWGTQKGGISSADNASSGKADGSLAAVVPGGETIKNAIDAISSVPDFLNKLWGNIGNPNWWLRVGQIVLGIVALIMGAMMIGKQYLPSR